MTTRVRLLVALGLVALAAVLLLRTRSGANDDASSDASRQGPSSEVPALREESTEGEAPPADPTLKGRPTNEKDDGIPRGVRVIVRSKSGLRIPEAGVDVIGPGKDGVPQILEAKTTLDGSVFLPDVPLDGSARVRVRASARDEPSAATVELRILTSEVVATVEEGLPLEVRCVDDLTGRLVRDATVRGEVPRSTADGGLPEGDDWVVALVGPNQRDFVVFHVDAPPGFVAWDRSRLFAPIGAWTHELEAVYPLRRETDVRVSVLSHEGLPEGRARLDSFRIANRARTSVRADHLGPGVFRLRGVPFFRRAMLTVVASAPDPDGMRTALETVWLGAEPGDTVDVTIRLPPPGREEDTSESRIGLGGGAGGAFGTRPPGLPRGEAVVEVLRHDGSPASNVRVQVGRWSLRTNADGRAHFLELPVAQHKVVVYAIGLLPLEGTVSVQARHVTEITLREPAGGGIDLHVLDADGEPLPHARITLRLPSKGSWVDEHDGVQRIDPFTDHLGYRRLERVEPGTIEIEIDWGGMTAKASVVVPDGGSTSVTITVP